MTMNAPSQTARCVDLTSEQLADIARALGHPARLALVGALAEEPRCCGHLVEDLAQRDQRLAQSTVSQHLSVLVDAGLVERSTCGVQSHYRLNPRAFEGFQAALAAVTAPAQEGASLTRSMHGN
ncbi:MAG: winged helix-turn-helix transcriptional regulator [Devosiaceae bacterium]|nr:winged helix-turn-helix transcriptional regulator [Devosiaceae bacterium MH13]